MIYDFDNWRAKYVLEALACLEEKWADLIKNTDDPDIRADYSNDLMQLHILQEGFDRRAVETFGPGVKEFSREPLTVALTKP
jgi:hypothetical protein